MTSVRLFVAQDTHYLFYHKHFITSHSVVPLFQNFGVFPDFQILLFFPDFVNFVVLPDFVVFPNSNGLVGHCNFVSGLGPSAGVGAYAKGLSGGSGASNTFSGSSSASNIFSGVVWCIQCKV
jgi:hypothetical protein